MTWHEDSQYSHELTGLARRCPNCDTIAHYNIKGRKEQEVVCFYCGHEFKLKKYRKGERPKAR